MNSNHKNYFDFISDIRNQRWIVSALTLIIVAAFLLIGNFQNKPGFPLDDAWIHQTYAKNLAHSGQWEYIPGVKSAGSTSPLWTMLLSLGFMLGMKTPFLWTSILSVGMLVGIALVINEILQHFFKGTPLVGMAGSLLVVLDWHLLWSAGSGMETLFYCLTGLYIFWLLISGKYWGWIGAVCGLIVWIRPDGITMLGPVLLLIIVNMIAKKFKVRDGITFAIPFIGLLLLYGWFNHSISGSIFPNTFYAKQMEYASVLQQPIFIRLGTILLVPISGAGLILIPGFIYSIINSIKKWNWWLISSILWFFGYGIIYALRLPMVYQHGRYLFPLIPVFYLIGILGSKELITTLAKKNDRVRKFSILFSEAVVLCAFIFAVSGEMALITDIKTIDQLMVQPALWVKDNSPDGTLVAVHDIGAMGYFGDRKIIDLAGLIQPELIPIIRDEQAIKAYLVQSKADYLVVFQDWYTSLGGFGKVVKEFKFDTSSGSEIVEIKQLR
jgi:hypothetical protein